jgi:hypothetical protein
VTTPAQRALAHVRALTPEPGPDGLLDRVAVTVNFHPDRLLADGRTVAEHLAAEGVYRSQFETGISNGGLTAYPGAGGAAAARVGRALAAARLRLLGGVRHRRAGLS